MKRRYLSTRYIVSRLRVALHMGFHPHMPWLTQEMNRLLPNLLRPDSIGFEYGSGASTMWFARRLAKLVSVEHNGKWYEIVKKRLCASGLSSRVDYRYCPNDGREWHESEYVRAIQCMPECSIDICLIDGKARDVCAIEALPKIKSGGCIIVDNVERYMPRTNPSSAPTARSILDGYASDTWKAFAHHVDEWQCLWTTNGVWDTAMWIKPA